MAIYGLNSAICVTDMISMALKSFKSKQMLYETTQKRFSFILTHMLYSLNVAIYEP